MICCLYFEISRLKSHFILNVYVNGFCIKFFIDNILDVVQILCLYMAWLYSKGSGNIEYVEFYMVNNSMALFAKGVNCVALVFVHHFRLSQQL